MAKKQLTFLTREGTLYVDSKVAAAYIGIRHDHFTIRLNRKYDDLLPTDFITEEKGTALPHTLRLISEHGLTLLAKAARVESFKKKAMAIVKEMQKVSGTKPAAPINEQTSLDFAPKKKVGRPRLNLVKVDAKLPKVGEDYSDLTDELVEVQDGETLVNSRQVAYRFDKRHDNVVRDIREIIRSSKLSSEFFHESTFENRGKQYPVYRMNRDGFSLLAMGFTGKKALNWKLKFIAAFNAMEKQLKEQAGTYEDNTPKTYLESLKQLVAAVEQNEQLKAEQKILVEENVQVKTLNQELIPKAQALDVLTNSDSFFTVDEVSKMIAFEHMGQHKLFAFLRKVGILIDSYTPYQKYVNARFVKAFERSYTDRKTGIKNNYSQVKFTQKGINYIIRLLLQNGYRPLHPELLKDYPAMNKQVSVNEVPEVIGLKGRILAATNNENRNWFFRTAQALSNA